MKIRAKTELDDDKARVPITYKNKKLNLLYD